MTQDRARKQAIRRRMEQTGEKYTEARRALLGGGAAGEPPWYHESYWEKERRRYEEMAAKRGEALARAGVYAALHNWQLLLTLVPLRATGDGGEPFRPEGWLPHRDEVARNAAAIEASMPLVAAGFGPQIERNRRIVDRVFTLIDQQAESAAERARKRAEERRLRAGEGEPARSSLASRRQLVEQGRSHAGPRTPARAVPPTASAG